ncbi:hypothetical protein HAX54_041799, partial [Datura stramonium]|nr:hypothetical protein [Datura stramonium]
MQTRNGARSTVQNASVGTQNVSANTMRAPETTVPQPPHADTLEAEFRGAI